MSKDQHTKEDELKENLKNAEVESTTEEVDSQEEAAEEKVELTTEELIKVEKDKYFERALTHIEDDKEAEELRKGVLLIYQKLVKTLEQKGLTTIEVNAGDVFDSETHQAITQIPAPTDDLKGKVIDCVEKGYKLGDKIIRHPKVVVGQA